MAGGTKLIADNRRARHDYHLLERFEAGLVLTGTEVKSLRDGKAQLKDGYANIRDGELWLYNVHIPPYGPATRENHEPERPRKLLMHKREIERLIGKTREKGLTLVPLDLHFRNGYAKVTIAVARGKRKYDKREAIKRREMDREGSADGTQTSGDDPHPTSLFRLMTRSLTWCVRK